MLCEEIGPDENEQQYQQAVTDPAPWQHETREPTRLQSRATAATENTKKGKTKQGPPAEDYEGQLLFRHGQMLQSVFLSRVKSSSDSANANAALLPVYSFIQYRPVGIAARTQVSAEKAPHAVARAPP